MQQNTYNGVNLGRLTPLLDLSQRVVEGLNVMRPMVKALNQ